MFYSFKIESNAIWNSLKFRKLGMSGQLLRILHLSSCILLLFETAPKPPVFDPREMYIFLVISEHSCSTILALSYTVTAIAIIINIKVILTDGHIIVAVVVCCAPYISGLSYESLSHRSHLSSGLIYSLLQGLVTWAVLLRSWSLPRTWTVPGWTAYRNGQRNVWTQWSSLCQTETPTDCCVSGLVVKLTPFKDILNSGPTILCFTTLTLVSLCGWKKAPILTAPYICVYDCHVDSLSKV